MLRPLSSQDVRYETTPATQGIEEVAVVSTSRERSLPDDNRYNNNNNKKKKFSYQGKVRSNLI
jgi:hypothetical protein